MTDSMNFGPEWLRNLSSEGTTTGLGSGGVRCQLADHRYGREEMLALFDKGASPPSSLATFSHLYSEQVLPPLTLQTAHDDERQWTGRGSIALGLSARGRGIPGVGGERGGRISRGLGRGAAYPPYNRTIGGYESTMGSGPGSWATSEPNEYSPRKDFTYPRNATVDNWRRNDRSLDDEDRWRNSGSHSRPHGLMSDKWPRSSWREGDEELSAREKHRWHEASSPGNTYRPVHNSRRSWDMPHDDHLPEWATDHPAEGGGTFDSSGAFHGSSDDDKHNGKTKELQKSASQQNIRTQHASAVMPSKSAASLASNSLPKVTSEAKKPEDSELTENGPEPAPMSNEHSPVKAATPTMDELTNVPEKTAADEQDFEKLQEDLVSKLVVDEEPAKSAAPAPLAAVPPVPPPALPNGVLAPPPNLMQAQLMQDKWFYQDPQGDLQGPFHPVEMADWYKAGYFHPTLFVRRQCDDRFYTLGELVASCSGNPFLSAIPMMPPMKTDSIPESEMNSLHFQQHQQFLHAQMMRARSFEQTEPWNTLPGFQRTLFTPQAPASQAPPADMLPASASANPLLHQMMNQMKIGPPPALRNAAALDESSAASNLDPLRALVQQMGGLQMQARHSANGIASMSNNNNIKLENEMLQHFIQQQQNDQRIDLDSLWKVSQFQQQQQKTPTAMPPTSTTPSTAPQWSQSDLPINMWDPKTIQTVFGNMKSASQPPPEVAKNNSTEKKVKRASGNVEEQRKQTDSDDKEKKKLEAEEKRIAEQRKLEEKRKKDEDRVRRELEKVRKEAEEKRQRDAMEKKRLKEQRKLEEEAKRKAAEEAKRMLEEERQREEQHKEQQQPMPSHAKPAKAAPWSQAINNQGLNLAEIQKLERERKSEVMMQQQQQLQQLLLQQKQSVGGCDEQTSPERGSAVGLQLNWAHKPLQLNHVKSLSEIQAEEQDRMLKQKEKEKVAQKEKEKEITVSPPVSTIWRGQSLTWNNSDSSSTGFWEDSNSHQQLPLQPRVSQPQQQHVQPKLQPQSKQKQASKQQQLPRNAESANCNSNNNNNGIATSSNSSTTSAAEFTNWCVKTLESMNTKVDIPTFVSFLQDIESALDVRDYCREYLGDHPATKQFGAQFLERRRLIKPKHPAYKDDMCSPAPAITPSMQQHSNNDFQEVKGKGRKCKKSKMLKVDARILGFNVTAAQDRINVGDRDYGEA